MNTPIICFGQQPCGFFPKRFLVAKINTARRLQESIGGKIVFFYHDSDHDPRETRTILRHRATDEPAQLNFTFENKTQRKFSPLYTKRVQPEWIEKTIGQLANYVGRPLIDIFKRTEGDTVADFCLAAYREMGLLDGIEVVRSSDPAVRQAACCVDDFFVDIQYDNEIVRARHTAEGFVLHGGGDNFIKLPLDEFEKAQVSPTRDSRLKWMQSVINCTHYVSGAGEQGYMRTEDAPEIEYVLRDVIDRSDEAYVEYEVHREG
jgi:hypothetical protein